MKETIESHYVSQEFKRMARANGFTTPQNILHTSLDKLHELPYSGYRILKELLDVLEQNGLKHLFDD